MNCDTTRSACSPCLGILVGGAVNIPSYSGNITDGELSDLLTFLSSRHRRPMLAPPEPVSIVADPAAEGAKVFRAPRDAQPVIRSRGRGRGWPGPD
jgi:hypothetical protein